MDLISALENREVPIWQLILITVIVNIFTVFVSFLSDNLKERQKTKKSIIEEEKKDLGKIRETLDLWESRHIYMLRRWKSNWTAERGEWTAHIEEVQYLVSCYAKNVLFCLKKYDETIKQGSTEQMNVWSKMLSDTFFAFRFFCETSRFCLGKFNADSDINEKWAAFKKNHPDDLKVLSIESDNSPHLIKKPFRLIQIPFLRGKYDIIDYSIERKNENRRNAQREARNTARCALSDALTCLIQNIDAAVFQMPEVIAQDPVLSVRPDQAQINT